MEATGRVMRRKPGPDRRYQTRSSADEKQSHQRQDGDLLISYTESLESEQRHKLLKSRQAGGRKRKTNDPVVFPRRQNILIWELPCNPTALLPEK